jgi:ABC-type transporter Mla MlaB component
MTERRSVVRVVGRTEGSVRLVVSGHLERGGWIVQVIRVILDELERSERAEFTVDMAEVEGFDQQAMSLWVGLERFVSDRGGHVKIVHPSQAVLSAMGSRGGEGP